MNKPPRHIINFFRWFCRVEYVDDIEGDLLERYEKQSQNKGTTTAKINLFFEVLKLLRPGIIKESKRIQKLKIQGMFRHNLLITLRSFNRYKSSFLINLIGLSTGMAAVLLIYMWVTDELSIDKFHAKDDRLYQIMGNYSNNGNISTWNGMPTGLAEELRSDIPDLQYVVGATDRAWGLDFKLEANDKKLVQIGRFVGKDFFNMFSYDLTQGDPNVVLKSRDAIVISEALALSLFGTKDVIGKSIGWEMIGNQGTSIISGVFSPLPSNSTDRFDMLIPFERYIDTNGRDLINPTSVAYVLLNENSSKAEVDSKIQNFLKDRVEDSSIELFLQKYSDQYLHGNFENGVPAGGRIEYVHLFSIIAIFILSIACVNFMNLSTARASRRMKEVGVKKSFGVPRAFLITQYIGEAVTLALISLVISVLLVGLVLPDFNQITEKTMKLSPDLNLILSGISIALITGILAGSYPAFYLSSFKPVVVLKGKLSELKGESWIRKGLVIFQFSISIILIIAVFVVFEQIEFIQNKNLGYDRNNLVRIRNTANISQNFETFLQEMKNIPGVENASAHINSLYNPPGTQDFSWPGSEGANTNLKRYIVHYDFIETLGLELVAGKSLSRDFNKPQIVINEKAAKHMELSEPVGTKVRMWGNELTIVGVVKDFHFSSYYQPIGPMFFHMLPPDYMAYIIVRLDNSNTMQTMSRIEDFYKKFSGTPNFEYQFIEEDFNSLYESEKVVASLSRYFAGIAIIISCLGLFGLAMFTAERRSKEIGIRKILGSSILGIAKLLLAGFNKLLGVSILIGVSIGYFISKGWLENFAFRIDLDWWLFTTGIMIIVFTAWLSVGWQVLKVARINPVKSLRDE